MPKQSELTKKSYEEFEGVLSRVLETEWKKLKSEEKKKILSEPEKVIERFRSYKKKDGGKYSDNSLRAYFTKIHVIIKRHPSWKMKEIGKAYVKEFMELNKKIQKLSGENKKTETQSKNWVEWPEVEKLRDKVKEQMEKEKNEKKKWKIYQDYLILSLYTYKPPVRSDYEEMKVVKYANAKLPEEYNYISTNKKQFIFNQYKTNKKKSKVKPRATEIIKVTHEVPGKLMKIIREWIGKYRPKIQNGKPNVLLVKANGEALKGTAFKTHLQNIFIKNGLPGASIDILRHSYIKHMYDTGQLKTLNQRKKLAEMMMHSVMMQAEYYKE
jgi:hypothetical protein